MSGSQKEKENTTCAKPEGCNGQERWTFGCGVSEKDSRRVSHVARASAPLGRAACVRPRRTCLRCAHTEATRGRGGTGGVCGPPTRPKSIAKPLSRERSRKKAHPAASHSHPLTISAAKGQHFVRGDDDSTTTVVAGSVRVVSKRLIFFSLVTPTHSFDSKRCTLLQNCRQP